MNRCPYCGKNMASEYSPQVFVAGLSLIHI